MNFSSTDFDSCWKLISQKIWHNPVEVIVFSCAFPGIWVAHDALEYIILGYTAQNRTFKKWINIHLKIQNPWVQ